MVAQLTHDVIFATAATYVHADTELPTCFMIASQAVASARLVTAAHAARSVASDAALVVSAQLAATATLGCVPARQVLQNPSVPAVPELQSRQNDDVSSGLLPSLHASHTPPTPAFPGAHGVQLLAVVDGSEPSAHRLQVPAVPAKPAHPRDKHFSAHLVVLLFMTNYMLISWDVPVGHATQLV